MIGSITDEICILRNNKYLNINRKNSNRYRILINEDNGSSTSYYFSSPIYNNKNGQLLDLCFHKQGNVFTTIGSNAKIRVEDEKVTLENDEGKVKILFDKQQYSLDERIIISEKTKIYPTLNGVAIKVKHNSDELKFHLRTEKPFFNLRNNTKYFALMSGEFKPYISVSAIGMFDSQNKLCSPARMSCQKIDDNNYIISIFSASDIYRTYMFEINLYEPKIFQDTTVETKNTGENNAFGGMGFIGKSETFGEQWLYSRLDTEKISEIFNSEIYKVNLHIPKYNNMNVPLIANVLTTRFCSFGSKWDNKVPMGEMMEEAENKESYCSIDLTGSMVNKKVGKFRNTEGFILKPQKKDYGFLAIATGDNYYTPQILEVNFR